MYGVRGRRVRSRRHICRPCVGLLKAENAHLATVRPLFYRAEPVAGSQGPWQIGAVSLE